MLPGDDAARGAAVGVEMRVVAAAVVVDADGCDAPTVVDGRPGGVVTGTAADPTIGAGAAALDGVVGALITAEGRMAGSASSPNANPMSDPAGG